MSFPLQNLFYKIVFPLLALAGTGFCADWLCGNATWASVKKTMPEVEAESLADAAGTGMALATVGGFRTILADIAWLRAFCAWENRNLNDCETLCALARTLAPQNYFFWENSANYAAYDFPNWIISARGGARQVSVPVQAEIHRKAYERGLEIIRQAAARFPKNGHIWCYAAQLCIVKTSVIYEQSDFETALGFYERAILSENCPWFAPLAYANITRLQVPARTPRSREFLQKTLSEIRSRELGGNADGNAKFAEILAEALEVLDSPAEEE